MNLISRIKDALTPSKPPLQQTHQLRIRANKNVPSMGLAQGQIYRMDKATALLANGQGLIEILDVLPGVAQAAAQKKAMQEAQRGFEQRMAENRQAVDAALWEVGTESKEDATAT